MDFICDPVDLRAGLLRRLLCRLVGDAGAAHAADGGDQRDLLGDHRRRADRARRPVAARDVQMARARRGGAGQRQHLRRLRGDRADARHVQEEGALAWQEARAAAAWVLLAYLVAGSLLHPRAARAVEPDSSPARQPLRHGRHGDRGRHDARLTHASQIWRGVCIDRSARRRSWSRSRSARRSASSPRGGSR